MFRASPGSRMRLGAAAALLMAVALAAAGEAAAATPATAVMFGGEQQPPVVLLHGLARSAASMATLERALQQAGYRVCNVDYPSRQYSIEALARDYVAPAVARCTGSADRPVHFVTHSMGGIIVRQMAATGAITGIRRVVMLGPPNHGSELVDQMQTVRLFSAVGGPAGSQLNTGAASMPQSLGPAGFELGIIAGTRSVNPLLSLMIPGADDGKVSVESARLDGASDFLALAVSHPFIMVDGRAIAQTLHFLRYGAFADGAA